MVIANNSTTKQKVGAATVQANLATTPGKMQAMLVVVGLLSLLLWVMAHISISLAHYSVQTIGKDSVPSIIAAQQVRYNLADMDANADNAFFSHGTREARANYEKDREAAADMLVSAAQNITYGNEERTPILAMTSGVQQYVAQVAEARTMGYPKGLDTLREASAIMHSQLLPAADALDQANFKHLDAVYSSAQSGVPASVWALWLTGALALLVLLGLQLFLLRRMNRIFNVPIVAASLILALWLLATGNTLHAIDRDLKVAKEDAFDSIDALWKTRAVAYDANGFESLYLLESGSRGGGEADAIKQSEAAFSAQAALIADVALTPEVLQQEGANVNFKGYLASELKNITFDGEAAAAHDTLKKWAAYLQMDAHIRDLEKSGRHQEAVDFCTGNNPGESNWGFAQFDSSLSQVIDINQKAFDKNIAHAFVGLVWLPYGAVIVPLLILLLTWIGLLPRLREYAHG